jgi:arylsulfatase A-like enzyme
MKGDAELTTPRGPNVLFILTDDQGWDDIGLHGNQRIRTPRLDALGRSSVRCDN